MTLNPKILVATNLQKTSPLWSSSLVRSLNIFLETNPARAVQHCVEILPDLIVLEIESESLAIDLIKKLREEALVPLLLLSSVCSEKFILDTYLSGVDEYIPKPIHPTLLHAKLIAWLRHSSSVPTSILDPLKVENVKLAPADRNILFANREPIHLTNFELRLLYILMRRPDHTMTTEELCHAIWGDIQGGDIIKLKNVVYRLRRKIELDQANPRYLITILGVGYKFTAK